MRNPTTNGPPTQTDWIAGVGLHSGRPCRARVSVASAGQGLRFRRTDLADATWIPAAPAHASGADRCTRLGTREQGIATVEHLLAAMAALGLWDACVEVDGPEIPIGDGSAATLFDALGALHPAAGPAPDPWAPPSCTLTLGASSYRATPAGRPSLQVRFRDDHPAIGTQEIRLALDADAFAVELAGARTFGRLSDAEALHRRGLALGATTANCLVLDDTGPVEATVRWPDEFVRHKALDVLGDLALVGRPLAAEIQAEQPSHRGNVAFARMLADHLRGTEDVA